MKAFACWEGAPWGNVASGKRKAPRAERERRTAFRVTVGEQSGGALAAGAVARFTLEGGFVPNAEAGTVKFTISTSSDQEPLTNVNGYTV